MNRYHARRELRGLCRTRLVAQLPAGVTVTASPMTPLDESDFPAVVISTPTETIEPSSYAVEGFDGWVRRDLTLQMECYSMAYQSAVTAAVTDSTDAIDQADELAGLVEKALEYWRQDGWLASTLAMRLMNTETSIVEDASPPVACVTLQYRLPYNTEWRTVTDPLVDHDGAMVEDWGAAPGGQFIEHADPVAIRFGDGIWPPEYDSKDGPRSYVDSDGNVKEKLTVRSFDPEDE